MKLSLTELGLNAHKYYSRPGFAELACADGQVHVDLDASQLSCAVGTVKGLEVALSTRSQMAASIR